MTEKIFEVSTRFDGDEIKKLQQYTAEELFEWGKDFADKDGLLSWNLKEETLEKLNEVLDRYTNDTNEPFWDRLSRIWTIRIQFFDKNDDNDTEEAKKAQEIFYRGMFARFEEVLKSVIQQKEAERKTKEKLKMTGIRIVEYCGDNTFTEGWEQIYSIQPMQALTNSDFCYNERDYFAEAIETEISESELLALDGDIVREFGDRLRDMLEDEDEIGVLVIERKY